LKSLTVVKENMKSLIMIEWRKSIGTCGQREWTKMDLSANRTNQTHNYYMRNPQQQPSLIPLSGVGYMDQM